MISEKVAYRSCRPISCSLTFPLAIPWPRNDEGDPVAAFVAAAFVAADRASGRLGGDLGPVVGSEDHDGVLDQFAPLVPRVAGLFQVVKQPPEGHVVLRCNRRIEVAFADMVRPAPLTALSPIFLSGV